MLLVAAAAVRAVTPAELCGEIGDRLASVSGRECRQLGMASSGGVSVEGRPILIKTYSPLPEREPLGKVLVIGGIHGDEYSSVSIVFQWLQILDRHHSGLFHWRIAPLLNPDGLLRHEPQRMNANGVDLNRNFPLPDWAEVTTDYWTQRTDRNPHRYPGPRAVSEPESRWLIEEIRRFEPDMLVAVHAPYTAAEYNHDHVDTDSSDYQLGRLSLQKPETYPGSLGRYIGMELGKPFLTIELPHADRMPSTGATQYIWLDLLRWLEANIPDDAPALAGRQHTPK